MKYIELFGGIGSCTKAFKRCGIDAELIDYVEIDKYPVKSFNAINGTEYEPQDICEWNKDYEFPIDLIMHGSPCQDFSLAGDNKGGDKGSGTRSSLMYETVRIVSKIKPKVVIWENVKNLLSGKHKHNYDAYCKALSELGYKNYSKVLNAKHYGIPQNRERVFTVSVLGSHEVFQFPQKQELKIMLPDLIEENADEKYILNEKGSIYVQNPQRIKKKFTQIDGEISLCITAEGNKNWTGTFISVNDNTSKPVNAYEDGTARTIKSQYYKTGPANFNYSSTFGATGIKSGEKIRKLTPLECWRLMGFDDEDFEKAESVNSNTQLYKQAGNSIVVQCLEGILKQLQEINVI